MTAVLALLPVVLLVTGAGLVLPPDRRRGAALVAATVLTTSASSLSVPATVRHAVVAAAVAVLGAAVLTPRRWPSGPHGIVVTVLVTSAATVTCVLVLAPSTIVLAAELAALAVLVTLATATASSADRRLFLRGLVAWGCAEAVLGVVEAFVTHRPLPWGYKVLSTGRSFVSPNRVLPGGLDRVEGTLGHPIPFAVLLAVCLVVVLLAPRGTFSRPAVVVAVPVLSGGLLLSGSRSVLLALLVAAVHGVLTADTARRAAVVVVSGLAVVVGAVLLGQAIVEGVGVLVASGSWENRWGALESVPLLFTRPLVEVLVGSGFGSEPELYARGLLPQTGFTTVDNQLVTTFATVGLLGVAGLVALFVVGFRTAGRAGRGVVLVMAVALFSFDYFAWFSMVVLLHAGLALDDETARRRDLPADGLAEAPRAVRSLAPGRPTHVDVDVHADRVPGTGVLVSTRLSAGGSVTPDA